MKQMSPGPILSITADSGIFAQHVQRFEPTSVSLFYGMNGTGKSTLAQILRQNKTGKIEWKDPNQKEKYEILVFDQKFIQENFSEPDHLPGIFRLAQKNIQTAKKLEELHAQINQEEWMLNMLQENLQNLRQEKINRYQHIVDGIWKAGAGLRREFPAAFIGMKTRKVNYAEKILNQKPEKANRNQLVQQYDLLFNQNFSGYPHLSEVPDPMSLTFSHQEEELLKTPLVSSSSTQFAKFLEEIGGLSWLRHSHEVYQEKAGNQCPYCQQQLPDDFEASLQSCFDAAYLQSLHEIQLLQQTFLKNSSRFLRAAKQLPENLPSEIDRKAYLDKVGLLESQCMNIQQQLEEKYADPALSVSCVNLFTAASQIQNLRRNYNQIIEQYSSLFNEKGKRQQNLHQQILSFAAWQSQDAIENYQMENSVLEKKIKEIEEKERSLQESLALLHHQQSLLLNEIGSTQVSLESMNRLLTENDIEDFSFVRSQTGQDLYEMRRSNGEPVRQLSEGEKSLCAFLYFCQLVFSSQPKPTEKIVVIDDPVYGLDEKSQSLTASLCRQMISSCLSLDTQLQPVPDIAQVFVFTHSIHFFQEVSAVLDLVDERVCFYELVKEKGNTTIKQSRNGEKNISPAKPFLSTLWRKYFQEQNCQKLIQITRNLLFHTILLPYRKNPQSLYDYIIRQKEKEFIIEQREGGPDKTALNIAKLLLYHLGEPMESSLSKLENQIVPLQPEQIRQVTQSIFTLLNQQEKYQKNSRRYAKQQCF